MADQKHPVLTRLGDTEFTVADPSEDIRGHSVIDQSGEDIGTVDGLLIDDAEHKVRFLHVAAGGFLGIGEKTFLIPVDAISSIEDDQVRVDQRRERIVGGPVYDPDLAEQPNSFEDSYGYYGYMPFWGAGYAYPGLAASRRRPV